MIDKLMENIAHKDRTITQLSEEKQALIVDYMAHERMIAGQEAELARLRAEVEILVWNLAGISTMACRRTPILYNREMARPTLNDVAELVKDYARLRAANAEQVEALSSPELLETLAAIEHERWSGWMKYQAEKAGGKHPITGEPYEIRWKRQSETPYARLPEQERESDRVEVRKTLAVIRAALSRAEQAKPETCAWARDSAERVTLTSCGEACFCHACGGVKFCPFCGKRIEVRP